MLTCLLVGALSFWTFVEVPVAFLLVGKMKLSYERWWERQHVESVARGWGARPEQWINNTRRTSVRKTGTSVGSRAQSSGGAGVAPHRAAVHRVGRAPTCPKRYKRCKSRRARPPRKGGITSAARPNVASRCSSYSDQGYCRCKPSVVSKYYVVSK